MAASVKPPKFLRVWRDSTPPHVQAVQCQIAGVLLLSAGFAAVLIALKPTAWLPAIGCSLLLASVTLFALALFRPRRGPTAGRTG
jgi:hypothetical protein